MGEEYQHRGFHPSLFFQTLLVNFIMRIVGAIVRIVILIIGLAFLLFVLVFGGVFFIFWLIAPFAIPLTIAGGVLLLIP